jgi:hypothetical protein
MSDPITYNTICTSTCSGKGTGPQNSTPLHWQKDIISRVFDDGQNHSLPMRLHELAARYHASPCTVPDIHSLVGLCKTFRLHEMLTKILLFQSEPSETGLTELFSLLDTKRQRVRLGLPVAIHMSDT